MKFFLIQAKSNEEAEVFLYGTVGTWDKINSRDFIARLKQLEKDYKNATFRLHSPGGSIFEGLAIYDAMRNSPLKIKIQVDGMAASMGSIIALAGDEVVMTENARFMIHQGRGGVAGSAKEMRNYAKLLESMNEQLAEIYASHTGKTKAWILQNWMAEGQDTWFTAKEALAEKLVSGIVKGGVQKEAAANLEGVEEMAAFYDAALEDESFNDENKDKMKLIAKHLGLPEDATEQQIIDAVENIRKDGTANSVAALMLLGKKSGLITDQNEATYRGLAEKDFKGVKALIENHKAPGKAGEQAPAGSATPKPADQAAGHESLVDAIKKLAGQNGKSGNANDRSNWTFADWSDKDEAGLLKMKAEKPVEYEALVKAYYGSSVSL
jgi:ATP-dependent Clp endopeptidase proteolytic subunit ClpP